MNNYIIDPQVFYWINVLGILQTVFAVLGVALTLTGLAFLIAYIQNYIWSQSFERNKQYLPMCKKWAIIAGTIGLIFVFISVFIPGKSAGVEMLVAKTATFDNVNWTVQQVKEVIDYIVYAIKGT